VGCFLDFQAKNPKIIVAIVEADQVEGNFQVHFQDRAQAYWIELDAFGLR
jgi:hypothetical protein